MNDTLDSDLAELRRLGRLRRQLELPANLYESHAPKTCRGDCESPTPIGDMGLTCCHFFIGFELYHDARRLEKSLRERVDRGRSPQRESATDAAQRERARRLPLAQEYHRDFTGTHVMRRNSIEELRGAWLEGESKETPKKT